MDSKFFNNILVLLFPDRIFKSAVKEEDAFKPLSSLLFSAIIFSVFGLYVLKNFTYLKFQPSFFHIALVILSVFFIFVLLNAATSLFLNWACSIILLLKRKKVTDDFLGNFCTHAYTTPLWMFLIFLHVVLYPKQENIFFIMFSVAAILRFLDIEARLVKAVYKISLMQGYMLVFIQSVLFLMGSLIGYFIRCLIAAAS